MAWYDDILGTAKDILTDPESDASKAFGSILDIAGPVAGAAMAADAARDAARIEAEAITAQGERQDRLARDTMATGIDYANEQRDLVLGSSDYTRLGSAAAYANMLDMLGIDRSNIDFGMGDAGTGTGSITDGTSSYTPGYRYDLNRLNLPNEVVANAPRYDFQTDPGYEFRLREGMRGLENSAAARGGLLSGGFARDAMTYNQDVASTEYGRIFDRLARTAGMGVPASSDAGAGTAAINNAGLAGVEAAGSLGAAGSSYSQGRVGAGNAWAEGFNQMARNWGAA